VLGGAGLGWGCAHVVCGRAEATIASDLCHTAGATTAELFVDLVHHFIDRFFLCLLFLPVVSGPRDRRTANLAGRRTRRNVNANAKSTKGMR
jgi:hypothetical protein